jgi:hypothetical protein
MIGREAMRTWQGRVVRATALVVLAVAATGCDGETQLQDLDRGRDTRPGIKESPPEESQ